MRAGSQSRDLSVWSGGAYFPFFIVVEEELVELLEFCGDRVLWFAGQGSDRGFWVLCDMVYSTRLKRFVVFWAWNLRDGLEVHGVFAVVIILRVVFRDLIFSSGCLGAAILQNHSVHCGFRMIAASREQGEPFVH